MRLLLFYKRVGESSKGADSLADRQCIQSSTKNNLVRAWYLGKFTLHDDKVRIGNFFKNEGKRMVKTGWQLKGGCFIIFSNNITRVALSRMNIVKSTF